MRSWILLFASLGTGLLIVVTSPWACDSAFAGQTAVVGGEEAEGYEEPAGPDDGESAAVSKQSLPGDLEGAGFAEGFYYALNNEEYGWGFFSCGRYEEIGDGVYLATCGGYVENLADYTLYDVGIPIMFFSTYSPASTERAFIYNNSDHKWYDGARWVRTYGAEGQNTLLSMDRSVTDVPLSDDYQGAHMSLLETDEVALIEFGDLLPGERIYPEAYLHMNFRGGYRWSGYVVSRNAHGPILLTGLEIVGPSTVPANSWTGYKAIAHYEGDISRDVTVSGRWWVEPATAGHIQVGLLTTGEVNAAEEINIYAAYNEGEIALEAEMRVEIDSNEPVILRVPTDYPTIQAAIDAAAVDDTVVVEEGRYTGPGNRDIRFDGKGITVRGVDPYDPSVVAGTIIDCNGTRSDRHCGFIFDSNEDANSILAGVTITNGYGYLFGTILCSGSSPQIVNCTLSGNQSYRGRWNVICENGSEARIINCTIVENTVGGIVCRHSSPAIINCAIKENGGGISCGGSRAVIMNCIISENSGYYGGGISCWDSTPRISNCTIARNTAQEGGGIYGNESSPLITNCTIVGNKAESGGGVCVYAKSNPTMSNCILWGNAASSGPEIALLSGGSVYAVQGAKLTVSYSDVQGGEGEVWEDYRSEVTWGEGNIDSDPCFVFGRDWHLSVDSACVDAGTNAPTVGLPATDIEGGARVVDGDGDGNDVVDMGAWEYDPSRPSMALSATRFFYAKGFTSLVQKLLIRNCGGGVLNWEILEDCEWLEAEPASGTCTSEVSEVGLVVDPEDLMPGYYNCVLTVVDPDGVNRPVTIHVTLCIGRTLHVPADYGTIQAAIDAAYYFDTIIVAPGRYAGDGNRDLDFRGKPIIVRSTNPSDPNIVAATIIDCNGTEEDPHRGFCFHSGEDANSIVDGLTITNGYAPWEPDPWWVPVWGEPGGGVYCWHLFSEPRPRPTIRNCIITGNSAIYGYGGGIYGSSGPIINCTISDNSAQGGGGLDDCTGPITNCVISNNIGGGLEDCPGPITNCIISTNEGHGTVWWGETASISNCTISGNKGAGVAIVHESNATITNCIVWGNAGLAGAQIYVDYESTAVVSYSDIQGGQAGVYVWPDCTLEWGEGNIDEDPLVTCDGHLQIGSPCINAGDPNGDYSGQSDVDGETRVAGGRVDIGADEYIDSDSDGLPDWWEVRYFGDPNSAEPNADPDLDGHTNLTEYVIYSSDPTVAADTYYVDSNRPDDSNDGLSWETAKRTIQAAIDEAAKSDRVIVAEGRYTGEGNRDLDFGGRWITVRCTNPSEPNVVAATIIDCNGSIDENHRGFYFHTNEKAASVVEGFTITGGCADRGGAISCYGSSPTIRQCNITGNTAEYGGGIDCNQSSAKIVDCNISGNYAAEGGGMFSFESGPMVIGCTITGNLADSGGGAYDSNSSKVKFTNCTFSQNRATRFGGGVYCYDSSPVINHCGIIANESGWDGGAICGNSSEESCPQVLGCTISGNSAGSSGGALDHCGGTVSSCIISGNSAPSGGGLSFCSGTVSNCTIMGNSGGVLLRSRPLVRNCIIWENRPAFGNCVLYCCVQGAVGDGCISSAPCFVEAGYWDANGVWVEGDYHLEAGSPCIDSGDNNSVVGDGYDLDGNTRIVDGDSDGEAVVDMGAYEFYWPPMEVAMRFTPRAFNPESKGRWIKAHFVLPEGYAVGDVDANRPAVVEPGGIESEYMNVFVNEDGLVEIKAAFSRGEFCGIATGDEAIEVTATGWLTSGQQFYGTDIVKITSNALKYLAGLASYWLEGDCGKPDWCGGVDVDQDSVVNFVDFALFDGCCIEIGAE